MRDRASKALGVFQALIFGQVRIFSFRPQDDQLHVVGDERFQDVVTVGEQFADGVVGLEQGCVTGLPSENGKLACPGELGVVGIDLELGRRWTDVGQLLQPGVMPVLLRAEIERGPDKLVAFRIINLELLARADGPWFQLLTRLCQSRPGKSPPSIPGVGAGVSVLPQSFVDRLPVNRVSAFAPRGIERAQRAVDGVAKFMHADALIIVAVNGEAEQVFFAEAGGLAPVPRTRSFW